MSELITQIVTGLVRLALAGVVGWLISHGVIDQAGGTQLIGGIGLGIIVVLWSLWAKYGDHLQKLVGLAMPAGSTIAEVKAAIKNGATVPASTPVNVTPKIVAILLMVGLGGLTLTSCGDNPRVQLLHGSQSITAAVQGFQQAENAVCGVDATTPTHCDQTYPGVTAAQLDAAHVAIEKAIGTFATDKIVFDKAAAAWQAGQGAPVSLSALTADANLAITTLHGLPAAAPISDAIAKAQAVLALITQLVSQFTGK